MHEDWGATPNALLRHSRVFDEMDIQVSVHTDSLNEGVTSKTLSRRLKAVPFIPSIPRGAGGGHAPDIIKVGQLNVLPSSTNPTLPFGINTRAGPSTRSAVCHNLNPNVAADVSFAESPRPSGNYRGGKRAA